MDPKIKQLKSTTFNGRHFTRQQLSDMQRKVTNFPKLSRNDLAQTICENLKWRTPSGGNSYQVCLGVLRQLEQLGVLQLPPKVESQRRGGHKFFADRTRRAIAFASTPADRSQHGRSVCARSAPKVKLGSSHHRQQTDLPV